MQHGQTEPVSVKEESRDHKVEEDLVSLKGASEEKSQQLAPAKHDGTYLNRSENNVNQTDLAVKVGKSTTCEIL